MEDKPDTCIINVGTNRLSKDDPSEIHNDIKNIVKLCHSYGVNNVYVSLITYRLQWTYSIDNGNLLRGNKQVNIDNYLGNLGPNLDHFMPKFDNLVWENFVIYITYII